MPASLQIELERCTIQQGNSLKIIAPDPLTATRLAAAEIIGDIAKMAQHADLEEIEIASPGAKPLKFKASEILSYEI